MIHSTMNGYKFYLWEGAERFNQSSLSIKNYKVLSGGPDKNFSVLTCTVHLELILNKNQREQWNSFFSDIKQS